MIIACFTSSELANKYMLYAFKINDGPIGQGTNIPQSESATKSARLHVLFFTPVNENIKVIVYYQMLCRLEFDQLKAVLVLLPVVADFTQEKLFVWSQGSWQGSAV